MNLPPARGVSQREKESWEYPGVSGREGFVVSSAERPRGTMQEPEQGCAEERVRGRTEGPTATPP